MRKLKSIFYLVAVIAILFHGADLNGKITSNAQNVKEEVTEASSESDLSKIFFDESKFTGGQEVIPVTINNNQPFFTDEDFETTDASYSALDDFGRCGPAIAMLSKETMATEERGDIGMIKPSGWHQAKYPGVVKSEPPYLYNRGHLLGFQFIGNSSNIPENLITMTRWCNATEMLLYEGQIASYLKTTENHVLYRVTPEFKDDELVARGVLLEAASLEDDNLRICVYCYNAQPGIFIDYATGESSADGTIVNDTSAQEETSQSEETQTYVLNTNTHKFHKPGCYSVEKIKPESYAEFTGTREEAIAYGYDPCKNCNP